MSSVALPAHVSRRRAGPAVSRVAGVFRARAVHAPAPEVRRLRLTVRGRVLLLFVLVGLLSAAFAAGRSASGRADSSGSAARPAAAAPGSAPLARLTVADGDTLWSIARRTAPDLDPRDVVAQLQRVNGLDGPTLQAGQQLLLPSAAPAGR